MRDLWELKKQNNAGSCQIYCLPRLPGIFKNQIEKYIHVYTYVFIDDLNFTKKSFRNENICEYWKLNEFQEKMFIYKFINLMLGGDFDIKWF